MIISGALLAESSSVVDNKLNIQGGVVDTFHVGPDRQVTTTLVVLTQPGESETSPAIEATFTNPIGDSHQFQLEVPESSLGGEIGFVCYPLELSVPTDGRYLLSLSAQGGFAALPVKVFSGG